MVEKYKEEEDELLQDDELYGCINKMQRDNGIIVAFCVLGLLLVLILAGLFA